MMFIANKYDTYRDEKRHHFIIQLLSPNTMTVDFLYCYPNQEISGRLPASKDESEKWRIIRRAVNML